MKITSVSEIYVFINNIISQILFSWRFQKKKKKHSLSLTRQNSDLLRGIYSGREYMYLYFYRMFVSTEWKELTSETIDEYFNISTATLTACYVKAILHTTPLTETLAIRLKIYANRFHPAARRGAAQKTDMCGSCAPLKFHRRKDN